MNRKNIDKIRLINWAVFQYEEVCIKGSTLFAGRNGTGKSTFLDALTYLLTANTQFNLAAKDRDRTVKGYVRGDTKSNGADQYLRTGSVVSYVAIEVTSEINEEPFVVGVCIESPNVTDKCSSYWFILKNTVLAQVSMAAIENGKMRPLSRKELTVKGKPLKMSDFMGREKAKMQILRALGLRCDADKYRAKLIKMMAFNPENNVDQFIQNCVLDAGNVNSLKELRLQKERFDEFRGIYENLKISKEKLDIVELKTMEYETQNRMFLNRSLMLKYQDALYAKDRNDILKRELAIGEQRLKALEEDIKESEKNRDSAQERYESAKNNPGYMDVKASIDSIRKQLYSLKEEISVNQGYVNALIALKGQIYRVKEALQADWDMSEEDERIIAALGEVSIPAARVQDTVNHLEERLNVLSDSYKDNRVLLLEEKKQVHQQVTKVLEKLRELQNNRVPYPEGAEKVRRIIYRELSKKYPDVQVRFFAELVQKVADLEWRKAIETFLGRKRFFLIVNEEYVAEALRLLNAERLYETNIIMTDKLPDTQIQKGSASEMLVIPNSSARKYANYLLNGIHLCDSVEALHEHPKGGIMRDGMLAKSYTAAMMDMSRTRCYMGNDAIALQIREYKHERDILQKKEEKLHQTIREMENKIRVIKEEDIRVKDYHFRAPVRLKKFQDDFDRTMKEKEKLESDPSFMDVLEEVNRARELLDSVQEELRRSDRKKGRLENEIEKKREEVKQLAAEIFEKTNRYKEAALEYAELEQDMKTDYEKLRKRSETAKVIKEKTVENLKGEVERAKKAMEDAQLDYLKAAGMNLERRGVSFIPFFNKEKNDVSNVKIEEASNKLETHAKEMETTFMTDFLSELSESISRAKAEVEMINEELKQLPFGNDTYRFIMEEREDRSAFFRIYRKLNQYGSVEMLQSVNAEDEELSHDIRSFMDKILDEQDESEYTDYRKYFKYDMKIRTKRGNMEMESDYSKKQGSASNGEKQTPYFIILAASLMQCYPKNAECIRVAFIDEAFAALSKERIEQMVKYLEDNRFQVLYAAPPEKISSIGDLIDTTVSLVSSGRYTKMVEGLVKV